MGGAGGVGLAPRGAPGVGREDDAVVPLVMGVA